MGRIRIDFNMKGGAREERFQSEGTREEDIMRFPDDRGNEHTITLGDKALRYQRSGEPSLDFTFEKGERHEGTYTLLERTMNFEVETHELAMQANRIYLVYTLKQAGQPIHHAELDLRYDRTEP